MKLIEVSSAAELEEMHAAGELVGKLIGCPEEEYHRGPGVSQSELKNINRANAYWNYRKTVPMTGAALALGGSFDCMIFTPERWDHFYVQGPDANRNTKAWKEWAAEEADGEDRITFKPKEIAHQYAMKIALNEAYGATFTGGIPQAVVYWVDGHGMLRRARADYLKEEQEGWVIYDLKTVRDARPDRFKWAVRDFRYDVQNEWYTEGFTTVLQEVHDFRFVCIEKDAPFMSKMYNLDHETRTNARKLIESDVAKLRLVKANEKLATEGYSRDLETLMMPKRGEGIPEISELF